MFDEIPRILDNRLITMVSDIDYAEALNRQAAAAGLIIPVHLKVDTGMGRMGCPTSSAPDLARCIAGCTALKYDGTATHFASSDSARPDDIAYTQQQLERFHQVLNDIRALGLDPGIVHAANSGAVLLHPDSWFDMVRPGILLYGYNAVSEACPFPVQPVMELRSNIVFIKQVKKGESLSYGRTWQAPHDTVAAVIPAGYADGLPRLASNRWQVLINDRLYPLAGSICMDQCLADLGPETTVKRWDEVSLFGGKAPDAAELAATTGTIPYEITCNINKRVPRVYIE